MVRLLHRFPCVATCNRPVYCGDLCATDVNESASVAIFTYNGPLAVLSKIKAIFLTVKHHPEPRRGEPTAEGQRPVAGMLPIGVWSMGKLRTSSNDDEMKIILEGSK